MVITHSEEHFRGLLKLWPFLFGGGVLVMSAAVFVPAGRDLNQASPLLAGT
jgi:hypothetical protein